MRVLLEHVEVRRLALELESPAGAEDPSPQRLQRLGGLLVDPIRYEEGTLFPLIEAAMPEDELGELAAAVERAERAE